MDSVRIDKYLWAIRLFKTRSEATEGCNGNRVRLGGESVKPSKAVKVGDIISLRKGSAQLSYRVLALAEKRMGASLVEQYAEDLTPESERAKLSAPKEVINLQRDKGTGRPTKKDRRQLEELLDELKY